jgi:HK97 family phage major capsid protein
MGAQLCQETIKMRLSTQDLEQLEERLTDLIADRNAITKGVKRERRKMFDNEETAEFRQLSSDIEELRATIKEVKEERQRADDMHTAVTRIAGGAGGDGSADISRRWSQDAASALHKMCGERRAVVSGSVDVPVQVPLSPTQFQTPFPQRLIDILPNRQDLPSMAFEFYQQTVRVNNAAPVADLAQKPVSQFTVDLVNGQAQYIATLTQPAPIRIWWDFQTLADWLQIQAIGSVWDAVEQQVISGNGSGINQTGILHTSGTTNIGASTDLPTTLRSARTALQNLGEEPTAWCLNPIDAELLDLTRWGSSGGFLSGGYQFDSGNGFGTSDNILGPSNKIARVITPHVPAGTALLADFRELSLFMRHSIRIDVATQGNPTGGQDLFGTNAFVIRAEVPIGVGVLRPQSFAVIALPGGS